jgi:hypothetical protein
VTFHTESGKIKGATADAGTTLIVNSVTHAASATVESGVQAGTFAVTANAGGFVQPVPITFLPALPARLVLSAQLSTAAPNGQSPILVTAELLRPQGSGTPSLNTRVRFVAIDSLTSQEEQALRREAGSNDKGLVSVTITSVRPIGFHYIAQVVDSSAVADTVALSFH